MGPGLAIFLAEDNPGRQEGLIPWLKEFRRLSLIPTLVASKTLRILSALLLLFGIGALWFSFTGLYVGGWVFFVPLGLVAVILLSGAGWVWHKASWLDLSARNPDAAR